MGDMSAPSVIRGSVLLPEAELMWRFSRSSGPGGHENYFDELAALLRRSDGRPDPKDISELRRRYDIEQITPLRAH